MNRKEYERFMRIYKAMDDKNAWEYGKDFFVENKIKVDNKEKSMMEFITELKNYGSYDNIPKSIKDAGAEFSKSFDEMTKHMRIFSGYVEFLDTKVSVNDLLAEDIEDNTKVKTTKSKNEKINDEPVISDEVSKTEVSANEVDAAFFKKMSKMMADSKAISIRNSGKFGKMEKALEETMKFLNDPANTANREEYTAKLEKLEACASAYLDHKINDGINKKAAGKINAATAMRDYIKERKAELFRASMIEDTEQGKGSYRGRTDEAALDFIKHAEVENTKACILKIFKKQKNYSEAKAVDMNKIFIKADEVYQGISDDDNFLKNSTKTTEGSNKLREQLGCLITAEFLRNELLEGGGEVTPIMTKFFENPQALANTYTNIAACTDLKEKANMDVFLRSDCKKNVSDAIKNSAMYKVKDLFNATFACQVTLIEEQKRALEKQKEEAAKLEKINAQKLEAEEKKKDNMKKYNETRNLANAYDNLAKFAKEKINGEEGKKLYKEWYTKARDFRQKAMFGIYDDIEDKQEKKSGKVQTSNGVCHSKAM